MSHGHHAYSVDLDGFVVDYDREFFPPQDEPEIELRIPHGIGDSDVVRLLGGRDRAGDQPSLPLQARGAGGRIMSPFTIDETGGEIPAGSHDVTIVEADPGVNANSGKPNLRVRFEDEGGRQVADWWTFSPAALFRWQLLWKAAGLDWPSGGGEIDEHDLIGRRVNVEVFEDTYNGVTRMKVKDVGSPVGSDVPDNASGFAAAADNDDSDVPF